MPCTIGFMVYNTDGGRRLLTAGHCLADGGTRDHDGHSVGGVSKSSWFDNSTVTRLADEVTRIDAAGADRIHVDVADGVFTPLFTLGPAVASSIRSRLPVDAHLLATNPDCHVTNITVQLDSCLDPGRVLDGTQADADTGKRGGVGITDVHDPACVTGRQKRQRIAPEGSLVAVPYTTSTSKR